MALHFEETGPRVEMAGRVADFCPICRELRPFTVRTRSIVRENVAVMFAVPFFNEGIATEDGVDQVCEVCNLDLPASPMRFERVLEDPSVELDELIERTNPGLRKEAAERLAIETRIRSGTISPKERGELLLEPFLMLDHRIQAAKGEPPGQVFTLSLAVIILSILGVVISMIFSGKVPRPLGPACGVLLILSILIQLRYAVRRLNGLSRASRVVRLEIHPMLGRALKPLNPSAAELGQILLELQTRGLASGGMVKADAILAEMNCLR